MTHAATPTAAGTGAGSAGLTAEQLVQRIEAQFATTLLGYRAMRGARTPPGSLTPSERRFVAAYGDALRLIWQGGDARRIVRAVAAADDSSPYATSKGVARFTGPARVLQLRLQEELAELRSRLQRAGAGTTAKSLDDAVTAALHQVGDAANQAHDTKRELRTIRRRAVVRHLLLETAHALIALLIFALAFGEAADRACTAVQLTVTGYATSATFCGALKYVVTIAGFVAERWFLGPRLDRFFERYQQEAMERLVVKAFMTRAHLEHSLAVYDELFEELRQALARVNALNRSPGP